MRLPFTRDAFLDVFAAYNERLWPFALVLWLATTWAFLVLLRAGPDRPRFFPGLLVIHWLWTAVAYHAALFSTINPAAWLFAGLFLVQAGLLARQDRVHSPQPIRYSRSLRRPLAGLLMAYALLYPAIARADGHAWPRLPTFGVPCPTTIFTIGYLPSVDQPSARLVIVVPVLWAFIGGSAAFLLGMRADLMLLVAGIVLAVSQIVAARSRGRDLRA